MEIVLACVVDPTQPKSGNQLRDHHLARCLQSYGRLTTIATASDTTTRRETSAGTQTFLSPRRSRGLALAKGLLPGKLHHSEWLPLPLEDRRVQSAIKSADVMVLSMLYPADQITAVFGESLRSKMIIWDTHNYDPDVWKGFVANGGPRAAYARIQLRRIRKVMNRVAAKSDMIIACTNYDQHRLSSDFPDRPVLLCRNGADLRAWSLDLRSWAPTPRFAIFGSLPSHLSTAQGALRFLATCWDSVKKRWHDATLTICGASPDRAFVDTAARLDGVSVLPDPDSIPAILATQSIILIPQYTGHGSKVKFAESVASGLPVVSTPTGAIGLPADVASQAVIVAEDDWVGAIDAAMQRGPRCEPSPAVRELDWSRCFAPLDDVLAALH